MASVKPDEPEPETCGAAFNNAWDCYSPRFQLTLFYRYGELDSCHGRWDAIWACMDRSKRGGQGLSAKAPVNVKGKEGVRREKAKPYWTLLEPKEAGRLWRANFGDKVPTEAELAAKREAAEAAAK